MDAVGLGGRRARREFIGPEEVHPLNWLSRVRHCGVVDQGVSLVVEDVMVSRLDRGFATHARLIPRRLFADGVRRGGRVLV